MLCRRIGLKLDYMPHIDTYYIHRSDFYIEDVSVKRIFYFIAGALLHDKQCSGCLIQATIQPF